MIMAHPTVWIEQRVGVAQRSHAGLGGASRGTEKLECNFSVIFFFKGSRTSESFLENIEKCSE